MRNPLASINLAAFNISRKTKEVVFRTHLDTITKKVMESNQIINNLLFYSRLRMPEYEPVNFFDLLNECIDHVQSQFKSKKPDVRRLYGSLENIQLDADPTQMKEVFNNILNNAFDAVIDPEGVITVSADLGTDNVVIRVDDNGSGIAQEDIKQVFDPFFTTKTKGTGLGLSVSRHIVNSHNGTIGLVSAAGKGTTVTVTLPRTHRKSS